MAASSTSDIKNGIQATVRENKVVIYSKSSCPYCDKVKKLFRGLNWDFRVIELDKEKHGNEIQKGLEDLTGQRTVPNVFIQGTHIGGCDDTMLAHSEGRLLQVYNGS